MRYTEYEFKVDHFFDILRIICCSLFRAPIQLVNEISKKIVYIEKKILRKVCFGSLVVNLILIVVNLGYNLFHLHRLNFTKGRLPLASLLIGLGFSALLLLLVDRIKEPKFIEGSRRNKPQNLNTENETETVEEMYQEDSLQDLAKIYGSDTTYKNDNTEDLLTLDDLENEQVKQTENEDTLSVDDFQFLSKISSIHDEENLKEMLNNVPDILSEAQSNEINSNIDKAVSEDKYKIASFVDVFSEDDIQEDLESSFKDMTAMQMESDNFMENMEAKFGYNLKDSNQDNITL